MIEVIKTRFGAPIVTSESPSYTGSLTVEPSTVRKTLITNGMLMPDDVVILPISVTYNSNEYGGTTAVIGKR